MTFSINHMASTVRNMDATIDFYTNVMGGQVTSYKILRATGGGKQVYIQLTDQLIEFSEPAVHTKETVYGLKHLAFETDDIDGAYKYLSELGYEITIAPRAAKSGNGRVMFLKDPSGVVVEVLQRDKSMYREPIESDVVCGPDHYAVIAFDIAQSHKFYHEHLGMENLARFIVGDNIREIMYLGSGTGGLEIVQSGVYKLTDNPHLHLAFRVGDIYKSAEILRERGADVPENAINVPGIQTGLSFSVLDPDGVRLELLSRCDLRDLEKNGITPETLPAMQTF